MQAAAAQRPRQVVERGRELGRPPLAGVQLEQQHPQRSYGVAQAGAAQKRLAQVTAGLGEGVGGQAVPHRLQLVRGAREVLDDAVVQVGGDAEALGLQRGVGATGDLLAIALLPAHAPGQEQADRQLGEAERDQQGEHERQEGAEEVAALRVDAARAAVRLDHHALAALGRVGHVDLDQLALVALEAVLGPGVLGHLGMRRAIPQRGPRSGRSE